MGPVPTDEEGAAAGLLAPLQALIGLLPDNTDGADAVLLDVVRGLDLHEAEAVRQFEIAGQSCLAKLSGATLGELKQLGAGGRVRRSGSRFDRALTRQGSTFEEAADAAGESVYELFERFDSDKDGVLSVKEFHDAFQTLTGGGFTQEELEALLKAADVNSDDQIDICEFTVWLYGGGDASKGCAAAMRSKLKSLQARLETAVNELEVKKRALDRLEEEHEEEMDATHDFWRKIAKSSVGTIEQIVNLDSAEWLGNGKYGFVLKAKRCRDDREVVVKMMGIRWAHLAVQEFHNGSLVKHPHIVEYDDVMLHNDDDASMQKLLQAGYEAGTLKSRTKRKQFPDRYICLSQELMNRGTVQDWLDDELLLPGGMFAVAQRVASALAYMHQNEVTHNDIKPENIMLHQEGDGKEASVIVKLGDLGLADKSTNRTADFWQYGMTTFCMVTGEKFGSRKYRPEHADGFCDEVAAAVQNVGAQGKLADTLLDIPVWLRGIFHQQLAMADVQGRPTLQDWGFFDGEADDTEQPTDSAAHGGARAKKVDSSKVVTTSAHSVERTVRRMGR